VGGTFNQARRRIGGCLASGDEEEIALFYRAIQVYVGETLRKTREVCFNRLRPAKAWTALAKRPADFKKLDRHLKGIERCMKLLYRIPDHRPTEKEVRDRRLLELKVANPDLSFGQIAVKYNLDPAHSDGPTGHQRLC
jgi:hypothetical protein